MKRIDPAALVSPFRPSRRRSALLAAAVAVAYGGFARSAGADTFSWNVASASSGNWNAAGNWLVGGVAPANAPSSTDSIGSPAQTGTLNLNIASPTVVNWDQGATQTVVSTVTSALTITGTLTKATSSTTLTFRGGSSSPLTVNANSVIINAGTILFGSTTNSFKFTFGSLNIANGVFSVGVPFDNTSSVTGTVTMGATSTFNILGQGIGGSGTGAISVGALSSVSTAVIQANSNGSSPYNATLNLTADSGSETYAGKIILGSGSAANMVSVVKNNNGTQTFSGGASTYNGGTTINGGTFLVTNVSGTATGTGGVVVNGGTLGGTGRIAPASSVLGGNTINASAGVSVGASGKIAPGTVGTTGTLTFDFSGTTGGLVLASGAALVFDLGATGTYVAPGTSDTIKITGATAGDVAFGGNVINFGATGADGFYKLFDSSLTAGNGSAWTGLTLNGQTITGGLTFTNMATTQYAAKLVLGNGTTFGEYDDIYVFTPEPTSLGLIGLGAMTLLGRKRRPSRRSTADAI